MSETAKPTPGPWGIQTLRTSCGVCHKIGPWPHPWRHGNEMSACIYDDYPSPPEGTDVMLANARLIASAPTLKAENDTLREVNAELLAELQNIAKADPRKWDEEVRDQFQQWAQNRARAAIQKAEGRT